MTDDQLKAMEASAPLLVAEVRRLQRNAETTDKYWKLVNKAASDYGWTPAQPIYDFIREQGVLLRGEKLALEEANKKLRTIHQAMEVLLGVAVGPSPGTRG